MTRTAHYSSPIGPIVLTYNDTALTGLQFASPADGSTSESTTDHFLLTACFRWLDLYFSGHHPDFTPPIDLRGTAFQQRVWHELLTIPYGQTVTYGEIARRVGCRSAQAVGGAVGRNPIALIVPCHRVVGSDGTLTGYAFGLRRKQYLLQLEQSN